MGIIGLTLVVGGLLLMMSLASGWIHRGPVTAFGLYLVAGVVAGPWMLDRLHMDIAGHAVLVANLTSFAMAASLFITGLKLRLPLTSAAWRTGIRLAFPAMLLTVAAMMVLSHWLVGLSWPLSLVFAAIVAPTDPVLASLISVNDARDDDALRVSLSTEAGMNDGSALPLLMLAVVWFHTGERVTDELAHWFAVDVLWSVVGGSALGFMLGCAIGMLATRLRYAVHDTAPNDFLALALIALSWGLAQALEASGFLASFAAGVGLRRAELRVIHHYPPANLPDEDKNPPAEVLVNPHQRQRQVDEGPAVSVGLVVGDALSFGDTVERLLAAVLMVLLGVTLAEHWAPMGLVMAALLFLLVRPLVVWLVTVGSGMETAQRWLIGWLGIRGIGSINYIAWAWQQGLHGEQAQLAVNMALTLVVASVVIHGVTVTPLLNRCQTQQKKA